MGFSCAITLGLVGRYVRRRLTTEEDANLSTKVLQETTTIRDQRKINTLSPVEHSYARKPLRSRQWVTRAELAIQQQRPVNNPLAAMCCPSLMKFSVRLDVTCADNSSLRWKANDREIKQRTWQASADYFRFLRADHPNVFAVARGLF